MSNSPEKMNAEMQGGVDDSGHPAEKPEEGLESQEALRDSLENSPEADIKETFGEIDAVDQEILAAQKSTQETNEKLAALRKDMGMPDGGEKSPAAEFQGEKIKQLEEKKEKLNAQKEDWINKNGKENLPPGIAFDNEEGGREANGGSFEDEQDQELTEEEKKEDLELRKKWLKQWEEDAVKHFEEAMREDWRTKDAMNLDLTVSLMKIRVPKAMDKEAEDFVNGEGDVPPFSSVRIRWQTSSLLERILDKPNRISKLEITFDDEVQKIADDEELKEEEKKEKETNNTGRPEAPGR
jgi:hypothetical protein